MVESQFNKFKEDNLRVLLALETEELLQLQGEIMQLVNQRNAAWFKEKLMLDKAQEAGEILDEEQLAFLPDPGISEAPVGQQIIPYNSAFQTKDLDAYDSDCDNLSLAKVVLMANLSSCDSDVLSESQDAVIQDTNSSAPNDLLVLSLVEQMTDHVVNLDKENQTNKMILILEEKSRSKMLDKQNDPILLENKIKISPIDYSKLNKIKEDFVKSHTPVRVEAPSKLPKSVENSDLNAQLQEKVFTIAALKNELKKLKGKNVVDTAISKPSAAIALGMFKLDIEPISHRLKNNRDAHEVYIEKTIENTDTLRGFIEHARTQNPSKPLLESACMFTKHIQELITYALSKSKKHSHKPKAEDSIQEKLYLLHMDLCGPIRVQSINGRKYILVIVDDFPQFTWVKFLRSKDEVPEFIIKFLKMIQVRLNAIVRNIKTYNGTKFVNQTLKSYYEEVGISHQTSVAHTPQQNGVVERRNCTLVEAA
ncbi:retrovirus-related pol polyprotein from transposon TNT 1-94 [Tanacetum coccineum]